MYTKDEMFALPEDAEKVLGVFAAGHTFNAKSEEEPRSEGLPLYQGSAPSVGEMAAVALRILGRAGRQFLLVVQEEGSDNFGNSNNASGTLVVTAADSDAGGGVVARAHGVNAEWLPTNVDTTDIYRMMYATLFGVWLEIEE